MEYFYTPSTSSVDMSCGTNIGKLTRRSFLGATGGFTSRFSVKVEEGEEGGQRREREGQGGEGARERRQYDTKELKKGMSMYACNNDANFNLQIVVAFAYYC